MKSRKFIDLSRRDFLQTVGVCSLIVAGNTQLAFALKHQAEANEWASDLRNINIKLLNNRISPEAWQKGVDEIYKSVPLSSIIRDLDFEAVRQGMDTSKPGGDWNQIFVKGLSSEYNATKVITKIVGLENRCTVPPHGHENEVSVFLTLNGKFRLRQWDRVAVASDSLDIVPAFDGISLPGDWSSQSEEKTNIHWLLTDSKEGYFLSVRLAKIDGTNGGRERIFIDPENAKAIDQNVFRVPIMDKSKWWEKYSKF